MLVSLLPDTLNGMHQWWSAIASLSLVILGATEVKAENRDFRSEANTKKAIERKKCNSKIKLEKNAKTLIKT